MPHFWLVMLDSTELELAAGRDGKAVSGSADGLFTVDSWTPCPPMPGCITVNIGDPLQFLSDGEAAATVLNAAAPAALGNLRSAAFCNCEISSSICGQWEREACLCALPVLHQHCMLQHLLC